MSRSCCRLVASVCALAVLPLVAFAEEPAQDSAREAPSGWRRSTGNDDYHRLLEVRTNDFGGVYEAGQPIPVAVEIRNLGPQDQEKKHPDAQLFPHLDVWVHSESGKVLLHKRYDTKIENRIRIDVGEKFVALLDVREVLELSMTGEYRISVGHENGFVFDLGDWGGTLVSHPRIVRIQATAAPK
jgi:hypothetical protein